MEHKCKIFKKGSKEKGITLVALVVTIVVLLILAGVSIKLVFDNNGIIERAKDAREQTIVGTEKEQVNMAYTAAVVSRKGGTITTEDLQTELDKVASTVVTDNGDGTFDILFNDTEHNYTIDNGKITEKEIINWDKILADATANPGEYKHEDQSSTNGDIGIGTDGKPVNMDLWTYSTWDKNAMLSGNSCDIIPGYKNSNIKEGKIIGKVPQYIKPEGKEEFYTVISMSYAFYGCVDMEVAPDIPTTATSMNGTFEGCTSLVKTSKIPEGVSEISSIYAGCTSLKVMPTIPSSVKRMWSAFQDCTSLTTAYEIPGTVDCMNSAFYGCTSLEKAPKILDGVKEMKSAFNGCTRLTTVSEIPSSVTDMEGTFHGCTSLKTAPKILSTNLTNMFATFFDCTSLTIAPEIPQGVTNMYSTFNGCTNLTTAPIIPSSVTDMSCTFNDCSKLQGNIEINANPTNYYDCFAGAATNGSGLTVTGSSTLLDQIIATGSSDKITKGN